MKRMLITGLHWVIGSLFLFLGLVLIIGKYIYPAIPIIIISIILMPPVRKRFHRKYNIEYGTKKTSAAIAVMVAIFGGTVLYNHIQDVKQKEFAAKEAKIRADNLAKRKAALTKKFEANRASIISDIKSEIGFKEYKDAVTMSQPYLVTGDTELKSLYSEARSDLEAQINKAKEASILKALKSVPVSNYKKNEELYGQLSNLYPDNATYKKEYERYKGLEAKAELAAAAKKARDKKIQALFSPWDGSLPALETAIKNRMNNPDSYKHVETVYWDKGSYLLVRTTFRGTNGFGAVVTERVFAKVDLNGNVIEILNNF